jgi:hypothetical protein
MEAIGSKIRVNSHGWEDARVVGETLAHALIVTCDGDKQARRFLAAVDFIVAALFAFFFPSSEPQLPAEPS